MSFENNLYTSYDYLFIGTRSTLLAKRSRDNARSGFTDWAFMTTHNWGEPAQGLWQLEIDNDGWDGKMVWKMILIYG